MANRRSFTRAPARRKTTWEGAVVSTVLTTGVSTASSIVSEAIMEGHPNPTIVRIRGELLIHVGAVGTTPSESITTLGLKLVTASAFAAGIASIETPGTEIGGDWIWWDVRATRSIITGIADGDEGPVSRIPIDSKAMRKVTVNKLLVLVAQNTALTSTQTVTIAGAIRVLLKQG